MAPFDVRTTVRVAIDETDLASPEDIVAYVVELVPSHQLRHALADALRDMVRVEFGRYRMGLAEPTPTRSVKREAIREAWKRRLRERVCVQDDKWTLLGECGYDQLIYLQSERLDNARRSEAAANRYGRLAVLVKQHNVARVADLPSAVLFASLSDDSQVAA